MGDTQLLGGLAQGLPITPGRLAIRRQQSDEFGVIAVAPIGQLGAAFPQDFVGPLGAARATQAQGQRQPTACFGATNQAPFAPLASGPLDPALGHGDAPSEV